jgi:hypothetical protein
MKKLLVSAILVSLLTSCATYKSGKVQTINVASNPPGASCNYANSLSSGNLVTPGKAEIQRSKSTLNVTCGLAGYGEGTKAVEPGANYWLLANITNLGIGYFYDVSNGAAWNYPGDVIVQLVPTGRTYEGNFQLQQGTGELAPAPDNAQNYQQYYSQQELVAQQPAQPLYNNNQYVSPTQQQQAQQAAQQQYQQNQAQAQQTQQQQLTPYQQYQLQMQSGQAQQQLQQQELYKQQGYQPQPQQPQAGQQVQPQSQQQLIQEMMQERSQITGNGKQ